MLKIGDFSRLARVSIKALRHYDASGLLRPAHVERGTGYRYYGAEQVERLQRILALKELGFSLDAIAQYLDLPAQSPAFAAALVQREAELTAAIVADRERLRRLQALRQALRGDAAPLGARLRTLPAQLVYARRERLPSLSRHSQRLFEEAERAVAQAGARADASPFALFHDREYRERGVDFEVCIPVLDTAAGLPGVREVAGHARAGSLTYPGSYARTPLLQTDLLRWILDSGHAVDGALREVYHRYGADQIGYRLPARVLARRAEDYITELQVPLL